MNPIRTKIQTVPTHTAVSLAEAKKQLNITYSFDDDYFQSVIRSSQGEAEAFTQRRFVRQTVTAYFQGFGNFIIPYGQLRSVDSVKYTDTDGNTTTVASSVYSVVSETDDLLGRVLLAYGQSWPTATLTPYNPIAVQFVCGWYRGSEWSGGTTVTASDYYEPQKQNQTGLVYQADDAGGTTGGTEPTWPRTIGDTVVDNTVTWTAIGEGVPEDIRQAVRIKIADTYEWREDNQITQGAQLLNLERFQQKLWYYRINNVIVGPEGG